MPDVPTTALDEALAALPARPRVHQLAKAAGLTTKQLLPLLAARGITVTSVQAAVDGAVARELLGELVGGAPAAATTAPAPEVPAVPETPPILGAAISPLFLPPAAGETPARATPGDEATDEPAPRRRRGRTPRRAAESDDQATLESTTTDGADAGAPVADSTPPATAETTASTDTSSTDTTSTDTTGDDRGGDEDAAALDDEAGGRGRRRRRGRRGRGRVQDDDSTTTDADDTVGEDGGDAPATAPDSEADTDDAPEEVATGRTPRARRSRRRSGRGGQADTGDDASTDDAAGDDEDEDADRRPGSDGRPAEDSDRGGAARDDDGDDEKDDDEKDRDDKDGEEDDDRTGQGTRRRRRRRRRSTNDDAPHEDDPDNTVVHVREPRAPRTEVALQSAASAASEVQGIRGSTRLEAKRQRRRDSRDSSRRRPAILSEAEFLARRESVERVMAVRQRGDLAQVALLEDGGLVEHFVSRAGTASMIGSIFLGKVQNVLPSMEAAFVDIGRGRNAVLYAGEVNWELAGLHGKARRIETALSSGDTVLAQVSKDPVGHKGARLTTQISLPGRFLVYVPAGGATGISRKLPDTERKRLKGILDRIVPADAGVIIRTAAEGVPEEELIRDVERLTAQWQDITTRAEAKQAAPTQLSEEPDTLIKVIRDLFNSDISALVIDGEQAYDSVKQYVDQVAPELADRVSRYSGDHADVFAAYRVDEQIAKALERKVHLPSGGSLVIDRTEAMTVIDVNTGKYTGSGGNLEETVTKNNLEAAEEVVRQLRLRDIGGIIVVDFIDMVLEANRELVMRRLTECLGRDRSRHQVAEVTSLGLVQMTRKRMGTGLVEAFSEPCPTCHGRGVVLHDEPVDPATIEEAPQERRAPKARRGRGREVADTPPVRTVPVAAVRPPDLRGPKPRTRREETGEDLLELVADLDGRSSEGTPAGTDASHEIEPLDLTALGLDALIPEAEAELVDDGPATAVDAGPAEVPDAPTMELGADEVGAVEIAVPAGADATDDGERPGRGRRGARRGRPTQDDSWSRDAAASAAVAAVQSAGPSSLATVERPVRRSNRIAGAPDTSTDAEAGRADRSPVPETGTSGPSESAVATPAAAAATEPAAARPRRRRAAGRPAGAPATAAAVDIVLTPPTEVRVDPAPATPPPAAPGDSQQADTPQTDSQQTEAPQVGTDTPAAAAAPRRRRAASRPAGPAATVPAPDTAGPA
ncbi:Rne/Rng family ribonuclease [Nakamurella flavida]|uniref:Ribonuclease E n=1 Tax=Nakamurella flavida TaxID=363630 RepID=A0A938YKZ9_9ACTN|nr:Rne/Rng family ribonuclease [Nakamurella flavida]MBM9477099.1 Rne/Rng family ribonuclease [Nakamurella flavida]MDP9780045.1 ribonuclease E [Nakamurella flavida]